MDIEELRELTADERIDFLKEQTPDFDALVENAMDGVYQTSDDQKRSRVLRAFRMRIDDYLSVPGGIWGGHALDHLPQGNTSSSISQRDYERLNATACGVAGLVYRDAGFESSGQTALLKYGTDMLEITLK